MKKSAFYYAAFYSCFAHLGWCNSLFSGSVFSRQKHSVELIHDKNQKLLFLARGSFRGSLGQVEDLLKEGVDYNVQDGEGYSSLHHAAIHCNVPLARLLLSYGADPELLDNTRRKPRDIVCGSCFEKQKKQFLAELDKD